MQNWTDDILGDIFPDDVNKIKEVEVEELKQEEELDNSEVHMRNGMSKNEFLARRTNTAIRIKKRKAKKKSKKKHR